MIGESPVRLLPLRRDFGLDVEVRKPYRLGWRPAGFRLEPHVELAHGPEDILVWAEVSFSDALLKHHENRAYAGQLAAAFLKLLKGGAGLEVEALLAAPGTEKPLSEGWLRSRKHGKRLALLVASPQVALCGSCGHPSPAGASVCPACGGQASKSWWKRLRGG